MKPTGPNTPPIQAVISRGYINALLERSRVVIAEAEAVIKRAEQWDRERGILTEQEQAAEQGPPSGGRVIPLEVWRGKRRGR